MLRHNVFNGIACGLDSSVKHWNDTFVFEAKSAITFNTLFLEQMFAQLCAPTSIFFFWIPAPRAEMTPNWAIDFLLK